MWCVPELTGEFVQRMEHLLDLYRKPLNPKQPVVCMDEKSKQLIADTRPILNLGPGKLLRRDHEYKRHGTRNIFLAVEPKGGKRYTKVTKLPPRKVYQITGEFGVSLFKAIERMQQGVYGTCLNCEEEIPPRRLEAVPWTPFCAACQDRLDKGKLEEYHQYALPAPALSSRSIMSS